MTAAAVKNTRQRDLSAACVITRAGKHAQAGRVSISGGTHETKWRRNDASVQRSSHHRSAARRCGEGARVSGRVGGRPGSEKRWGPKRATRGGIAGRPAHPPEGPRGINLSHQFRPRIVGGGPRVSARRIARRLARSRSGRSMLHRHGATQQRSAARRGRAACCGAGLPRAALPRARAGGARLGAVTAHAHPRALMTWTARADARVTASTAHATRRHARHRGACDTRCWHHFIASTDRETCRALKALRATTAASASASLGGRSSAADGQSESSLLSLRLDSSSESSERTSAAQSGQRSSPSTVIVSAQPEQKAGSSQRSQNSISPASNEQDSQKRALQPWQASSGESGLSKMHAWQ